MPENPRFICFRERSSGMMPAVFSPDSTESNMADLAKGNTSDVGIPLDTSGGTVSDSLTGDWTRDRPWWENNYSNRPYSSADRTFNDYEPGYRFGYQSANKYRGRQWNDVENNLRTDWQSYEGRGNSAWENVKDSVRDAWDRVTGNR